MEQQVFEQFALAVRAMQSCMLGGNPAPVVARLWERVSAPVPGDWVWENTVGIYRARPDAFGRLVAVRREPMEGNFDPDEERPLDTYWYIELPNGTIARWHNCSFIAIPQASALGFQSDRNRDAEEQGRTLWVEQALERHRLRTPAEGASPP